MKKFNPNKNKTSIHMKTTANKLSSLATRSRALANRINKTSQLGILSLLLVAGGAITLTVMSRPAEFSAEMMADWDNGEGNRHKPLLELKPADQIDPKFLHILVELRKVQTVVKIGFKALIHEIHNEGKLPYVVVIVNKSADDNPFILSIPKEMFTENGWAEVLKWGEIFTKNPNRFAIKWKYEIPGPPVPEIEKIGLPLDRKITNAQGASIEVTITAINGGKISFTRKGETKMMQLEIAKLSEEDQTFLKEQVDPNKQIATGPRILVIGIGPDQITPEFRAKWAKANIQATFLIGASDTQYKKDVISMDAHADFKALFEQYDGLWSTRLYPEIREQELARTMSNLGKPVVVCRSGDTTKKEFLGEGLLEKRSGNTAYVKVSENFVFYNDMTVKNRNADPRKGEDMGKTFHPETLEEAAEALIQLLKKGSETKATD